MKTLILAIIFVFGGATCFAQKKLLGAWYWSDSAQMMSLIFRPDGTVIQRAGSEDQNFQTLDRKEGNYLFKNNKLKITWKDGGVHNSVLRFLYKNSFQMTVYDEKGRKTKHMVFNEIRDEVKRE